MITCSSTLAHETRRLPRRLEMLLYNLAVLDRIYSPSIVRDSLELIHR
jgi:hypothetical protein